MSGAWGTGATSEGTWLGLHLCPEWDGKIDGSGKAQETAQHWGKEEDIKCLWEEFGSKLCR